MKKLLQRFETSMMAVVFAEAGEFDAALQIASEEGKLPPQQLDGRIMGGKISVCD
jgi:hypothetical protein